MVIKRTKKWVRERLRARRERTDLESRINEYEKAWNWYEGLSGEISKVSKSVGLPPRLIVDASVAIEKGGRQLEELKQKISEVEKQNPNALLRLLDLCREYGRVRSFLNEGRKQFAERKVKFPVPMLAEAAEETLSPWGKKARKRQFEAVHRVSEGSRILHFSLRKQSIDPLVLEGQKKQDRLLGMFIEMLEQATGQKNLN